MGPLIVLQQAGGGDAVEKLAGAVVVRVQLEARKGFEGKGDADRKIRGLSGSLIESKGQGRRPASEGRDRWSKSAPARFRSALQTVRRYAGPSLR